MDPGESERHSKVAKSEDPFNSEEARQLVKERMRNKKQ